MLQNLLKVATYNPDRLLDAVLEKMDIKNDAALCRLLGVSAPYISKIRHRRLPIGATLLVRVHEETGLSISEMRRLMGVEASGSANKAVAVSGNDSALLAA